MTKKTQKKSTGRTYASTHFFRLASFGGGLFVLLFSLISIGYQGSQSLLQASLIPENSQFDPLNLDVPCSATNEIPLPINGGSDTQIWAFEGAGISGVYGTISDGTSTISTIGESFETGELVTYTAPTSDEIPNPGTIYVKVTDTLLVDLVTGEPQSVTFTIHVGPSCIEQINLVDPAPGTELIAQQGQPFIINTVEAILFNGDTVTYQLPHEDIYYSVEPEGFGTFTQNAFYTTVQAGIAFLRIFVPDSVFGVPGVTIASAPIAVTIGSPSCELTTEILTGEGGSINDVVSSSNPAPHEKYLGLGESWILHVSGNIGVESIWNTSDESIVMVEPLVTGSTESTTTDEEGNEVTSTASVQTDFAKLTAVSRGVATITVTDSTGCTALLTVYVDMFPAEIIYAVLEGALGITIGNARNLLLQVEHLGGIDQIANIQVLLVKGRINSPAELGATPVYDVIDITREIEEQLIEPPDTAATDEEGIPIDPNLAAFTKLYTIPIYVPDVPGITNGRYTLMVIVTDQNAPSTGIFETYTPVPVYVSDGVALDFTGNNRVDIGDVVMMLRYITGAEQPPLGYEDLNLGDLIIVLRYLTGGGT